MSSSHTTSGCTCTFKDYAASWHDESCPRFANQCGRCEGNGGYEVRLSCECCSDYETCEECNGTGNAPVTDEEQSRG